MSQRKSRQALRDISKEQAMVRENWQLVHANIKLDQALLAFLTQTIDECGVTIARVAFELVHKILNPKGYVRLEHKAALENVGALIRNVDSSWIQQGKHINTRWDFTDVWWTRMPHWHQDDSYELLRLDTVDKFCNVSDLQTRERTANARYKQINDDLDKQYSLQKLDLSQSNIDVIEALPTNSTEKPITRWETKCHDLSTSKVLKLYEEKKFSELQKQQENLEPYWRLALRINRWANKQAQASETLQQQDDNVLEVEQHQEDPVKTEQSPEQSQESAQDGNDQQTNMNFSAILQSTQALTTGAGDDWTAMTTAAGESLTLDIVKELQKLDDRQVKDTAFKDSALLKRVNRNLWEKFLKINGVDLPKQRLKEDLLREVHKYLQTQTPEQIEQLKLQDDEDANASQSNGKAKGRRKVPGGGGDGAGGSSSVVHKIQDEYGYWTKHRTCRLNDKVDLVLKVGYFSEETGLYKQRIVWTEIDGHDKTAKPTKEEETDSIKLATKLMSSTSCQAVLQPETYHIRSNLSEYLHDEIQKSLFSTTNVEVPDFKDFIRSLQNDTTTKSDLSKFQEAIHWVHHLFLAHVKVAFLIHMREMHGIDMLSSDIRDERMRDHYFFINFTGDHLPDELVFQDRIVDTTKTWLEEKLMLLTRPKIKCCDGEKSMWKYAPVVNASSRHASMHEWTAKVRSMPVPAFPYEESSFMPIACATVQRVNMSKLCEIVKTAATQADAEYIAARSLRKRSNNEEVCRQFPDSCFLTRRQQFDREAWWNLGDNPLRQCCQETEPEDLLEFNWGYETPERKRSYQIYDKRWDQIDVRMHFFDKCMKKTGWKDAANGMWFIQDYADFMGMLQQLTIEHDENDTCAPKANCQLPNYTKGKTLPNRFEVNDRACHRFSVLSWFFDCRDAGACRYRWEDWVLDYFGAYKTNNTASDFEKFVHVEKLPEPMWPYFKDRWFEIVLFLEQNFRNAIAPMHYQLFEFENHKHTNTAILQRDAKSLYNRKTSMVNNRSVFAGLQVGNENGGSLLSFRRFDAGRNVNMTLRERVMSQLHDELPDLDPFLKKYIHQFRIPDAELFLRMIRCPNVLALRELAIQHRHLLAGKNTASSVQPPYHLQQTLKYFPLAVQSEILYMLKFVECDDSVYVHTPAIHETKLMIAPQNLMHQWIRETLDVAGRVQTLQTPLQIKCYMFTMQELAAGGVGAFHTLKQLFYTTEAIMNYGSRRGIVFLLLQIRLALLLLRYGTVQRSNPLVELFEELDVNVDVEYKTEVWENEDPVLWRAGTCLECWPRRDQNQYVLPNRIFFIEAIVRSDSIITTLQTNQFKSQTGMQTSMPLIGNTTNHTVFGDVNPVEFLHTKPAIPDMPYQEAPDMKPHERRLWLLLLYARPCLQRFTAEDYTSVTQKLTSSDNSVMFKKDVIVAKLEYKILDNRLMCLIEDNVETELFFEPVHNLTSSAQACPFPEYVQNIITKLASRKLIYVPKDFAIQLRKQFSKQAPLHTQMFQHETKIWKMACVGVRHWAWKRLMIKSIFFDAFSKIMTRASVQLSLYGPVQDESVDNLLQAHKQTASVFGDLQYKVNLLKKNHISKQVQLLFSVHEVERRQGRINFSVTDFDQEKIPCITRQMEFVKYCTANLQQIRSVSTCRYMLVDKRIVQKFFENLQSHELSPNDSNTTSHVLYRAYLYLMTPSKDMLVCLQNQWYIKFPTEYAVIRDPKNVDTYITGPVTFQPKKYKYATCFDTRTYSCAQPKLQRKADSKEFMQMIRECTNEPKSVFNWPSTNDLKEHSKSWIYQAERKVMLSKLVSPTIVKDLNCSDVLTIQEQQNMYTLPDYFSMKTDKITDVQSKCQDGTIVNQHSWTTDLEKWNQQTDHILNWISLRCTTKTICYDQKMLVENDENIDHKLLKHLLRKIRGRLLTPSFLNKS
jgi:hypothetical protein